MPRFTRKIDFASLGILDLIQARDSHHKQLANLPNVIGTAIGRYLIRADDPRLKDPNAPEPKVRGPRTIDKVTVANWSSPAVLVFVNKWQDPADFAHNMDAYIPARLYLEDGRAVPTRVVAAPSLPRSERTMEQAHFASARTAAGNALMRDAQEQERIGTVSCLVTDGADMYA